LFALPPNPKNLPYTNREKPLKWTLKTTPTEQKKAP
jgi:hypothetical protein